MGSVGNVQFSCISIHALREEGDGASSVPCLPLCGFLSTPSARRATNWHIDCIGEYLISIHALREEGDGLPCATLLWRRRFLSTPSARRATVGHDQGHPAHHISIHALREEGDGREVGRSQEAGRISIHALREEGDSRYPGVMRKFHYFYPRPPRGGRQMDVTCPSMSSEFLSTPSARRATPLRPVGR